MCIKGNKSILKTADLKTRNLFVLTVCLYTLPAPDPFLLQRTIFKAARQQPDQRESGEFYLSEITGIIRSRTQGKIVLVLLLKERAVSPPLFLRTKIL